MEPHYPATNGATKRLVDNLYKWSGIKTILVNLSSVGNWAITPFINRRIQSHVSSEMQPVWWDLNESRVSVLELSWITSVQLRKYASQVTKSSKRGPHTLIRSFKNERVSESAHFLKN